MENFNELAITWDKEPRRAERAAIIAGEIINSIPEIYHKAGFEYGCGTGLLSLNLRKHFKTITLADSSEGMLAVLEEKINNQGIENMKTMKIDLVSDPLPGEKYDVVYTLMTLHHILDTAKIVKAFHEILTPASYLCIADLEEEDGSFHGPDFEGHKGFNREALAELLTECGFTDAHSRISYVIKRKDENGIEKNYPLIFMAARKG